MKIKAIGSRLKGYNIEQIGSLITNSCSVSYESVKRVE